MKLKICVKNSPAILVWNDPVCEPNIKNCKDEASCKIAEEKIDKLSSQLDALQCEIKCRIINEVIDEFTKLWLTFLPASKIELLDTIIERIEIYPDRVWTYLKQGFSDLEKELNAQIKTVGKLSSVKRDNDLLIFATPVVLSSCCGRNRLEITGENYDSNRYCLLHAIALAWRWGEMLFAGEMQSIQDLAKKVGFSCGFVTRTLSLFNLAPSIVEDIINGRIPNGLSLAKMYADVPDDWEEQRRKWGFERSE